MPVISTRTKVNSGEITFPWIGKSIYKTKALIVLFSDPTHGTVIFSEQDSHLIGYHKDDWKIEEFENYEGTITLSNQGDN